MLFFAALEHARNTINEINKALVASGEEVIKHTMALIKHLHCGDYRNKINMLKKIEYARLSAFKAGTLLKIFRNTPTLWDKLLLRRVMCVFEKYDIRKRPFKSEVQFIHISGCRMGRIEPTALLKDMPIQLSLVL